MTLGQAIQRIQDRGYSPALAAEQRRAVIDASKKVFYRRRWPWRTATASITIPVGGAAITLPNDYKDPEALRIADQEHMEFLDPQVLRERLFNDNTRATPLYWSAFGGSLIVYPNADRAYTATLDYAIKHPTYATDGTSDNTELPGPEDWHELVVATAAIRSAHRERQRGQVQEFKDEAQQLWSDLIAVQGLRQHQSGSTVQRSGFFQDDSLVY